MNRVMPSVREAVPEDAVRLAALKCRTFRESFVEGGMAIAYPEDDMRRFEDEQYSVKKVQAELLDSAHRHWVACDADGAMVAYCHVGPCKLPHEEASANDGELYQLYVTDDWQGAGVSRMLLQQAIKWLEANYAGPIWLGVYSGNLRAQAIYVSRGFAKVGEYDFMVGNHRDREYIMRKG